MNPLFPQLLPFSDVALLCLRLMVAAVFFTSGLSHARDPVGRAASIGLSPAVTRVLGFVEMTSAAPGSAQGLWLIVSDMQAALDKLVAAGVQADEVFHIGANGKASGLDPERNSYRSFALFRDPDGNHWLFQEITTRLPGRIDAAATSFASATDLTSALRRAEAAHGEHERRTGQRDANGADWYAAYMVAEQSGKELPS
jgi:hypothetical protein